MVIITCSVNVNDSKSIPNETSTKQKCNKSSSIKAVVFKTWVNDKKHSTTSIWQCSYEIPLAPFSIDSCNNWSNHNDFNKPIERICYQNRALNSYLTKKFPELLKPKNKEQLHPWRPLYIENPVWVKSNSIKRGRQWFKYSLKGTHNVLPGIEPHARK